MAWYFYPAYFFAGAFFANAIPHFLQGICGSAFQTPFASPPGVGLSSPVVNVLWGFLNFVVGSALLRYFFVPAPRPLGVVVALALGVLTMALWLANHFGRVRNSAPHR